MVGMLRKRGVLPGQVHHGLVDAAFDEQVGESCQHRRESRPEVVLGHGKKDKS